MDQSLRHRFPVDNLQVDRLLEQWRWLCPASFGLVARNAFGDLFLRDTEGKVNWLDVTGGELKKVADGDDAFWEVIESDAIVGWDCSDGNWIRKTRFEVSAKPIYLDLNQLFRDLDAAEAWRFICAPATAFYSLFPFPYSLPYRSPLRKLPRRRYRCQAGAPRTCPRTAPPTPHGSARLTPAPRGCPAGIARH